MSQEKPLPFIYQFGAGAIAGILLTLSRPECEQTRETSLDDSWAYLATTIRQLQTGKGVGADSYNGMLDCFQKIVRNEGFSRLYRGISAPIMMEAPKRATKFAANDEWGKIYRKAFGAEKMTQSLSILTGASAGATESFVVVPFELVRALLPKAETKKAQITNDIVAGTVGGTVGTILNTPMDVVKSRIQNSPKVAGQIPKYNWAWGACGTVMKEEGFGALYKGFLPKVLRLGPGGGILLVVFTGVMVSLAPYFNLSSVLPD
ncbi:hypothetical protein DL768_009957 [Monosporascus sp. mg162]|nr:hypothetical protein DL768_009957 [Monosporascus sp. mg162]